MSIKKAIITKLTFSLLLLTIFSLVTANVKNITVDNIVSNTVHFFQDETTSQLSKNYFFTSESNEDSIKISEKEIEIEIEIEPFSLVNEISNLLFKFQGLNPLFFYNTNFCSRQSIPLYDLFCNWKLYFSSFFNN